MSSVNSPDTPSSKFSLSKAPKVLAEPWTVSAALTVAGVDAMAELIVSWSAFLAIGFLAFGFSTFGFSAFGAFQLL